MMDAPKTLIVKFRSRNDPTVQSARIRRLVGADVIEASQLFPGESEDELASLFEVVLKSGSAVVRALSSLSEEEQFEYAHPPAERGPL